MPKCQFVNPHINMPCGKQHKLTKIIFNTPKSNEPIIKYACKADGDARFRYLSTSEDRLTKEYKQNKMKWNDYKEQIGDVRWKKCRACNGYFEEDEVRSNITYYYYTEGIMIGLRRSFHVHEDCFESELNFFNVFSNDKPKNQTLETSMNYPPTK